MNVRRLTGTIFMVHPPGYFLFYFFSSISSSRPQILVDDPGRSVLIEL